MNKTLRVHRVSIQKDPSRENNSNFRQSDIFLYLILLSDFFSEIRNEVTPLKVDKVSKWLERYFDHSKRSKCIKCQLFW